MRAILSLLLLSVFHFYTTRATDVAVEVSPRIDSTVPVTFGENVTYECAVTLGTQPFWAINTVQLMSPTDMTARMFANMGIIIEIVSPNITRLILTPDGRERQLQGGPIDTIVCVCMGFMNAEIVDTNVAITVTTYNFPDPPGNLTLDSIEGGLALVWERPGNAPTLSNTSYTVSIFNVTESGNVLYEEARGQSETSFSIHSLEESLQGMSCQPFQFYVVAENDAGIGIAAIYNETVPLSANTSDIDATLRLVSLELGEGNNLTIVAEFRTVNSCSINFPVLDYTFNLNGRPALVVPASQLEPLILTRFVLDSRNLSIPVVHNSFYALSVTVRSNISERTSQGVLFQTTDVQSAEVVFYRNNVFLRCIFANSTLSQGCIFRFSPNLNRTEEFILTRDADEVILSQCNMTLNQRSAYTGRITVFDIESDSNEGSFTIFPTDSEIRDPTNFTLLTGCDLDTTGPLPPPVNVVAIVVPIVVILVFLAILIVILIVIVTCVKRRYYEAKLETTRSERNTAQEELDKEKAKKIRKPSLTPSANGVFTVHIDTGSLLDASKTAISPSNSSHSDDGVGAAIATPPPESQGGPPAPFLAKSIPTGSTRSYSPPHKKRPPVNRSFSEGAAEPLLAEYNVDELSSSKGLLQLSISKNSMEIKLKQDQLIHYLRKRREKSQRLKYRSKSIGNEMSAENEEKAPLLVTLSEIQFSPDALEAISEEHLEPLEESGLFLSQEARIQLESPSPTTSMNTATNSSDNGLEMKKLENIYNNTPYNPGESNA